MDGGCWQKRGRFSREISSGANVGVLCVFVSLGNFCCYDTRLCQMSFFIRWTDGHSHFLNCSEDIARHLISKSKHEIVLDQRRLRDNGHSHYFIMRDFDLILALILN